MQWKGSLDVKGSSWNHMTQQSTFEEPLFLRV